MPTTTSLPDGSALATPIRDGSIELAPPAWLDRKMYPFEPHHFATRWGRIHYVDEGRGEPVVLVHGTPTWSFLYRDLIAELSQHRRVITVDHLGFGLSDKPAPGAFEATPRAHAENLERLLESLDLQKVTLIVHDFGGPIGMAWAVRHPERIARLVVLNTWAWSNEGDHAARRASRLLGGAFGRGLYRWFNAGVRWLLPMAFADRKRLTPAMRRHYEGPFLHARDRFAAWILARELYGSNAFYDEVWRDRAALAGKPMRIVWGTRDPAFREHHLARWMEAFPNATVRRVEVGHFVQEEAPEVLREEVARFLAV